jgi:ERCC4-type nuclease
VISDRCAVERKSVNDFISSLFDGRLIDQLNRLSEAYEKPVLILEGDVNLLYADEQRRAFFLKTLFNLTIDYNIRLLFSSCKNLTKDILVGLLHYEKFGKSRYPIARRKPKTLERRELLKFILKGFPYIGDKSAEKLLQSFGSLRKIFTSPSRELMLKGRLTLKQAKTFTDLLDIPYSVEKENTHQQERLEA